MPAKFTVAHWDVRKFLLEYARPSVLDELIDAIGDDCTPEDLLWAELVRSVKIELVGIENVCIDSLGPE